MKPEFRSADFSATLPSPEFAEEEVAAVPEEQAGHRLTVEILAGGSETTVQDFPGRIGYRAVGVPPSGPMDSLSFRLANRLLENLPSAAALEITLSGPTLRFHAATTICLTGAPMAAWLDGESVSFWRRVEVEAGQTLVLGALKGHGCRAYLAVAGGFQVRRYLGSRSTFLRGGFGGHEGRALQAGDVLKLSQPARFLGEEPACHALPEFGAAWEIGVLYGPHAAPDFFTAEEMRLFFSTEWRVEEGSTRTGVRLAGPSLQGTQPVAGEAGSISLSLHSQASTVGAIGFVDGVPVILGPDGPGPGNYVCPACVVHAELWKVGQLQVGDRVHFHRLTEVEAIALNAAQGEAIMQLAPLPEPTLMPTAPASEAVQARLLAYPDSVELVCRPAGDRDLLIEYDRSTLDLEVRFRVHALRRWLEQRKLRGIVDLTPGARSLQVHYDPFWLTRADLLALVGEAELELADGEDWEVLSRTVHLPLSWEALERPELLEAICCMNGLGTIERVSEIVFGATYLVATLGAGEPGAPVAVPLDPRHRLRAAQGQAQSAWAPENAVRLGDACLRISGAEGPGADPPVGRTLPFWSSRYRPLERDGGQPWLLHFFDRLRFYPVAAEQLAALSEDFLTGEFQPRIEQGIFRGRDYRAFLGSIGAETTES